MYYKIEFDQLEKMFLKDIGCSKSSKLKNKNKYRLHKSANVMKIQNDTA